MDQTLRPSNIGPFTVFSTRIYLGIHKLPSYLLLFQIYPNMSSRREARYSDSKRHRSRFDQEPSPKRSRKHSRQETERPPTTHGLDFGNNSERELKHHRRLQDAVPLDAPSERTARKPSENVTVKDDGIKESADANEGSHHRSSKHSSNPPVVPRSTSFFQHDERGSAGQVDRSSRHKAASERGWWKDVKEPSSRAITSDKQMNDEKNKVSGKQNNVWRHDRYFEVKEDPKPPVKKRSFREEKIPVDTEKVEKAATELVKPNPSQPEVDGGRMNERTDHMSRHPGRYERPFTGERNANKGEPWRGKFPPRDRYHGNVDYMGRDRFNSRPGHNPSKVVEKWKHDLYDEANKSPPPKNEEDQIAKIEALLAS
ncbi:putative pre-mRNA-splicing factor CWC22 -like protein isoform X2 [Capsicum annuum]|nr:putative pre-mRNA-splicing factor CWC22 -like protein isoform X2 [Capsicum annuum]KAF3668376.1 putative pre-mRNA-splicing factor CWC22 -like protein isoform X2 [Capsicum annuum]